MGKLDLTAKLAAPKAAPVLASGAMDSKIARQQEPSDQVKAVGRAVATAVAAGPVTSESARGPRRVASAQIVVRSSEKFRRAVKRWALDENTSTQELIVTALRELYRARGLGKLPE